LFLGEVFPVFFFYTCLEKSVGRFEAIASHSKNVVKMPAGTLSSVLAMGLFVDGRRKGI
jgi:hypothetical protein